MPKDTPFITVQIELDSYLLANLLAALELVPATGEWMDLIYQAIDDAMALQNVRLHEFYFKPNIGMNIKQVRHHLNHIEHSEKYNPHGKPRRFTK